MENSTVSEPAPHRRNLLPLLIPLLLVSLLALGAVTYHLPYYAIGPGPSHPVDSLIHVPPDRAFPHKGRFLLTTVSLRDVTVFEALRGWLDPDVDVIKIHRIIGTEPTKETLHKFDVHMQRDMQFSRETAVEVALGRLGIPIPQAGSAAPFAKPPFDVRIDTGKVGGASGGLALTLGIIDTLTGGHTIAVAGTILFEGTVGDVDGIAQKTAAARAAGAEYLLVAPRNYQTALAHAGHKLKVLKVANLDQALAALRAIGGR